jgi:hypothetical protein
MDALHFPPILAAPSVLPSGSTLNFSMLFLKRCYGVQNRKDIPSGSANPSARARIIFNVVGTRAAGEIQQRDF